MISVNWTVLPGSRIEKMPRAVQPFAVLARELLRGPRGDNYHHVLDGIATRNNDSFRQDLRFRKAYDRAVLAAGWDYGIPYRVHQVLWCSRQAQKVNGDFVELGTGRGFLMSAVLADFDDWNISTRGLHLFDSFMSTWVDDQGRQSTTGTPSPYYANSVDDTRRNFSEWNRIHIHQGNVFDTLADLKSESIALLHIDFNFWEPEVYGLRTLYPRIPRGGVVLLDDYAGWGQNQQNDAMNALSKELGFDILSTPTGQGIIIK
jgi:hypothetical protein